MATKQKAAKTKASPKTREEPSPRYLQIARDLRAAIAEGRYPLGAQLPTEHELCEKLGVSRFTIREAIRVLASAGLIRRKPRAGTIVVALPDDSRYTHSVGSLQDLTQYAQETTLDYMYVGRIGLSRAQARSMHAKPGDEWIYAVALRREARDAAPLGVSRLFLNPAFKGIERVLRGSRGPVYSMIERDFGVRIERVEQVIAGIALDELDAENLGVAAGTPGLAITRSYFDDAGRVVEFVENVHPADRFTYRLQLTR
ncbi:MAG TPA: GntR family transcriptional regulator [Burkholderiales bacterium]|nr:GntR family transcriptional regulator [Burkholderiales bacterium]